MLLATAPDTDSFRYGINLARAAQAEGVRVHLYLLDQAVVAADGEVIGALAERGGRICGCALAARRYRCPLCDPVIWGGLKLLNDIIVRTDRFVGFCR